MRKKNRIKTFFGGIFGCIHDGIKKFIFNIKVLFARVLSRGAGNNVFYVNGPDALPPPLSKEEETECRMSHHLPSFAGLQQSRRLEVCFSFGLTLPLAGSGFFS